MVKDMTKKDEEEKYFVLEDTEQFDRLFGADPRWSSPLYNLWWKLEPFVNPMVIYYNLRYKWRQLKNIVQRMRYGVGELDTFELDEYLALTIAKSLEFFMRSSFGIPSGMKEEEWDKLLVDMKKTFEYYAEMTNTGKEIDYVRVHKAFDDLRDHFHDLWW